jgi:hypothetical protein
MSNFTIAEIKEFDTKQKVNKLLREGRCYYDEFISATKRDANLSKELGDLYAVIEYLANGKQPQLPTTRYRKLEIGSKLKLAIYEAKSRHLRMYLFHESGTGQILILGGKKTEQTENIEKIKRIAKEFAVFKLTTKK